MIPFTRDYKVHRFLLLVSLIPLLAAIILRKLNADRILRRDGQQLLHHPADGTARKMLDSMGHEKVKLVQKQSLWPVTGDAAQKSVQLPDMSKKRNHPALVETHGLAALRAGIFLLSQREPAVTAKRDWALRFGHVFPIFTTIVVIFAFAVGKLPVLWGLSIVVGSLGIASCAQVLALACERRAATLAAVVIEKKRIFPRLSEEEAVITAARAQAWRAIVPGFLSRLM